LSTRLKSKQPFISLTEATFRLGDRLIFPKSTWTFSRDEHWALLGANGSGKSLFADALRGLVPLVNGELNYHFRPLLGLLPEESIGHVGFEDRRVDLHGAVAQSRWNSIEEETSLRVRDVLSYERVMEINPFEVTVDEHPARRHFAGKLRQAVRLLQIGSFWDRTLLSLSNGERQRVQLARTLCHPLRLLILDDPFVGLDAPSRAHLLDIVKKLMATSLRILMITPRQDDLPQGITHVLWISNCQIKAAGERSEILESRIKCDVEVLSTKRMNKTNSFRKLRGRDRGLAELVLPKQQLGLKNILVELRNVTVRYGRARILRDVHWIIREGESWALLGPNGSGKSTLLSLVLGDNPQAYTNYVEVFGHRRGTGESIWELKRQIGSVSPELHLHFNQTMTCFEVVASGFYETVGLFEPPSASERKAVHDWLNRFDLIEFACRPLFELSLGQQRMVLLARALVKSPKLLILDEPCQGLDAAHRKWFVEALDELLRTRTTTAVYVTHRPDEIPFSIKRVLRLRKPKS